MTYAEILALGTDPNPRIIKASDNGYVCHIPAGGDGSNVTVISTPNTILVDYIEASDQTGFTIPAGAFGRKGATPYFGNSPIALPTYRFFAAVTSATTGDQRWNRSLMDIPVAAGELLDVDNNFLLSLNLTIYYTGGSPPNPNSLASVLAIAHQAEFDNIVASPLASIMISLDPLTAGHRHCTIKGQWFLRGDASGLLAIVNYGNFIAASSNGSGTSDALRKLDADNHYFSQTGAGPSAPGVAETLRMLVLPSGGVGTLAECLISGEVQFARIDLALP